MDKVTELSELIIALIRVGAVFRVSFLFVQMVANEDEVQNGKKRVKNTIKFYIIAELIFVLKNLIISYF